MSGNSRQNRAALREKSPIVTKRLVPIKKPIPGELELLRWISQAEYEVHVDPYRGIQSFVTCLVRDESTDTYSAEGTTGEMANEACNTCIPVGPWRSSCAFDATFVKLNHLTTTDLPVVEMTDSVEEVQNHSDTKPSTLTPDTDEEYLHAADSQSESDIASNELIRITCQSSCPSLIQWTSRAVVEQQKKTRYKKRVLVERVIPMVCGRQRRCINNDLSMRCSCDYNPFCLGTLGGAMDDALEEWSIIADMDQETHAHKEDTSSQLELDDVESTVLSTNGCVAARPDSTVVIAWDWSDSSFTWYKPETKALLSAVRKSRWISKLAIKQYLQKSLQSLTATLSLNDEVQRIQESHQSLIFHNPLTPSTDNECNGKLHLSLPPGIENLGATCYLNTQMQCLAQNRVFVQGIMSWQPPEGATEDRMNSILSLFQKLLLRMKAGAKCSVDTLEFSNALGLDRHEQQDPNEFSRLLFERMHASFQCSSGSDLAELLPHLFQGSMMYETSCLTCKTTSRRTEEFMDLNLPIVHPKKTGQQTISEALFAKGNTDVQYCLQEYCIEETLDGENKYFCSHCGCKRDAKRAMTFQKLPPVLNVQISRYVFDREKLIKKKLCNKVLLPLDLEITARSVERKEGNVTHRYVLCAVMRHKGTSAYSGHYVAEAMDWLTGQWFEFNDENVLLLESGPSCSFDPSTVVAKKETKLSIKSETKLTTKHGKAVATPEISGSQDAYNMYYVEESFLAQSALDCLRMKGDNIDSVNMEAVTDIERTESYAYLSELCIRDRREAELLERRRSVIRQQIIPAMRRFTLSNPLEAVWVDITPFLQFMACRELMSPQKCAPLCSHRCRGLHPRVARRGKLIPKIVFDTYAATIVAEQQCDMSNQTDFDVQESIPIDKIVCRDCSLEYQSELAEKLLRIKALKLLHDELNPKELHFSLQLDHDEDGQFAYAVSKKFVTWFRSKFAQLLKKASMAMNEPNIGHKGSTIDVNFAQSVLEGLDGFDLYEFDASYVPDAGSIEADEFSVNKQITCTHGKINAVSSKSVVYVPCRIWSVIKELFPFAIEHKRKRRSAFSDSENDDDNFELGCQDCRDEGLVEDDVRKNLTNLVRHCNEFLHIDVLTLESALNQTRVDVNAKFRLLHWDDLGAWHKFAAATRRKNDKKRNESLEAIAHATLFPASLDNDVRPLLDLKDVAVPDATRKRLEFLSSVFRPIMCKRHNLPIRQALFEAREGTAPNVLNKNICCMDENSYEHFLVSLITVSGLIYRYPSSNQIPADIDEEPHASISEALQTMQEFRINELNHPSYRSIQVADGADGVDRFSVSSDSLLMLFQLDQTSCDDEICHVEYRFWQGNEADKRSAGTGDTAAATRIRNNDTGVAHDPITVDSDIEEVSNAKTVHVIRVFDVSAKAESDSLIEALASCADLPHEDPDKSPFFVRRSSRKRKTRYPVGVVLEEESIRVDLHCNIAALRLLLMERCTKGSLFELDHSVKLLLQSERHVSIEGGFPIKSSERLKLVDLTFDLSSETLLDVCERELGGKIEHIAFPSDTIMLIRQSNEDGSSGSIPKEALMDHFIGLSNTIEKSFSGTRSSSQRCERTRSEKGFAGTFLSSTAPEPRSPRAEKARYDSDNDPELEEKKKDVHSEAKSRPSLDVKNSKPTRQSSPTVGGRKVRNKDASTGSNHFVDLPKCGTDSNGNGRNDVTRHDLNSTYPKRSCSTGSVTTGSTPVKRLVSVELISEEEQDDVELLKSPFPDRPRTTPRTTKRPRTFQSKESVLSNLPYDDGNNDASALHNGVNDDDDDVVLTHKIACLLERHPDLSGMNKEMLRMAADRVVREHANLQEAEKLANLAYYVVLDFIAE